MDELVSIILPIHNQADHISRIVIAYNDALKKVRHPYEILLIVNACSDSSLDVCKELVERYDSIRVIDSPKGGWGHAVRLGLREAQGNILCYTNTARTTAEDLVLLVLYAIANPEGVVKAHRRVRESIRRRAGSFLYNLECRLLFDLPTWDLNSTPKAFSRKVYESIELTCDGDLIDLEFFVECKQAGVRILEVPIYSRLRHGGTSTTTVRSAVRLYWGAYRMYRERRVALQ